MLRVCVVNPSQCHFTPRLLTSPARRANTETIDDLRCTLPTSSLYASQFLWSSLKASLQQYITVQLSYSVLLLPLRNFKVQSELAKHRQTDRPTFVQRTKKYSISEHFFISPLISNHSTKYSMS
jgi:hypothetical protein